MKEPSIEKEKLENKLWFIQMRIKKLQEIADNIIKEIEPKQISYE